MEVGGTARRERRDGGVGGGRGRRPPRLLVHRAGPPALGLDVGRAVAAGSVVVVAAAVVSILRLMISIYVTY